MFFQQPDWLREWLESYPRKANQVWPYWAAARPDTVRQWPDLFEALIRHTNWQTVSIGFESGSDRMLRVLNKECTLQDNLFTIDLLNRLGTEMEREGRPPPRFWANLMLGIPGETPEDAFQTLRMLKRMKWVLPSLSFYAPYPGSALGFQLIAEGKSLMSRDHYHRFPGDEKVKGVDYGFYRKLLAGHFDGEVIRGGLPEAEASSEGSGGATDAPPPRRHRMYLFAMKNGRKKLAWGQSPEDALAILAIRLSPAEMDGILPDRVEPVPARRLLDGIEDLG